MSVQCKWHASNTEINYLRKKRVLRRCMLTIGRLNLLISINNFENEWDKLVDAKVSHKFARKRETLNFSRYTLR